MNSTILKTPASNHEPASSPLKSLLRTSLPAVIDLASQTVMWTVESILIGKLSAAAFGGVGMALQVIILFMTIMLTFVVGSTLIITRYLGAGDKWNANHILSQALMLSVFMACCLAVFWYFGATNIFKLIKEGSSSEAEHAGVTYLRTIAIFAPFIITNFIAVGIIRGAGETHFSMMINLGINGLNLMLAPILIFGLFGFPRLEVRGAALAAGMCHTLGFFVTLYLLRSRKSVLFLSFRELTQPNLQTFKRLFKAGLPTTIEQLVWAFGMLVMTSYIAVLGVHLLAAHQVFMRIQAILSMLYMGFGMGAMTLMGKNLGAADRRLAQHTAETSSWVMSGCVLVIVIVLIVFSRQVISIFTTDPEVIHIGIFVMRVFALAQIPKALDGVLMGNLRGAGDSRWLMWITIISVVFIEIGFNWLVAFVFKWSLLGLWIVHLIDETLRLAASYWRFKGGKWKFLHV
ncbi:MAG: MATE family efflux transporter [candidate division KSB1 bacterium]|nr:MATE family efflux transporter [candidate division KSB1 bacterium]